VLFDMDGLLVDSEPLWTIGEIELAAHLGGTWTDELKATIIGTRLDTAVATILGWYGVPDGPQAVEYAMGFLLDRMVELYHERVPLMPGAIELVDAVRAAGIPTALVSSSYRVLVDAVLDTIGRDHFDVSVAGDEVTAGKPDPAPYQAACDYLEVDPRHTVAVEDAISGVRSAEAAGCAVLAVPWITPIAPGPRRAVRESLADIDVEWLLSLPH
jgi:HAD superfamily hydrolase (TIGR01509 family)